MPHDTRKKTQMPRFVESRVEPILPRAVRAEYLASLRHLCLEAGNWPRESIRTVWSAYKDQIRLACDSMAIVMQLAGMAYCFSATGMPIALAIVLLVMLAPLMLRSAYTYLWDINGKQWTPSSSWQYSMDSMGDAVITMVVVLLSQALMLAVAPQLAVKQDPLYRGIALGMPVLAAMRMAMRPRAQWQTPFQGSNLTADQIYKRTWWMNILWIACFQGIILSNPDFLPTWIPARDFLSTFIPMKIFVNWIQVQQNKLIRRDKVETVFGVHWRKKQQARQREVLMKGLKKGDPFYVWYIGLQGLLFLYMSIPLAQALWPWLAGTTSNRDVYIVLSKVLILIMMAWSWTYLKEANRAASDAMQQDIDSPDVTIPISTWKRLRRRIAGFRRDRTARLS